MINFRFHLVSLTAVFLALAAGITIGAGVVDRATVDFLERRVADVERNRDATNKKNDELEADLHRWEKYGEEMGDRSVEGDLAGARVMFVAVDGVDRGTLDAFRSSLQNAGATYDGAVWFSQKWLLADPADVRALSEITPVASTAKPDDLRRTAMTRLGSDWAAGRGTTLMLALRDAGFLTYDPGPNPAGTLADVPHEGALMVVVSSPDASVPSDQLAVPLVSALVSANVSVLAAQPVPPADLKQGTPVFTTLVRQDASLSSRTSSVDDIDDYRGRMAAILALEQMRRGRLGHYGFGPRAQAIVPEAGP
ncbi:MAG TPA: copper transporter [Acidimicrobiales bacterium]|nr:copper transporter [Acidimicrobiales bacterium]